MDIQAYLILLIKLLIFIINHGIKEGQTFNLSPTPSVEINEPNVVTPLQSLRSSYFGYSIVLRHESIIIGAPRAQSSLETQWKINETGAIYRCTLQGENKEPCEPFIFNGDGKTGENIALYGYTEEFRHYQWLGATMDGSENDSDKLLVCAPRFARYTTGNLPYGYMFGECYWSLDTLSKEPNKATNWKIKPLTTQQYYYENTELRNSDTFYRFGQTGFSAHITSKNKEFLMGAPFVNYGGGYFIRYNIERQMYAATSTFNDIFSTIAYSGYAVASGYLSNIEPKNMFYVVTKPRQDESEHGRAFILDSYMQNALNDPNFLTGTQYGEYFGYAALVVDVNNDSKLDVLITAPLYSQKLKPDVGAVYVFINKGNLQFERQLIESPFPAMARFGTSISSLGDINLDGFNDIAIGAPFANDVGAVAIYLGSTQGLQLKPSQTIYYPKEEPKLPTENAKLFGHGISKGVDIDKNEFNDVAIGAPESEKVFLYHSYPVISIETSLLPNPKKLPTNAKDLSLKICWKLLTNSKQIKEANITLNLEADPKLRRLVFDNSHQAQFNVIAYVNQTECRAVNAKVIYQPSFIFKKIEIELRHNLVNDGNTAKEFCSKCLVLDPSTADKIQDEITYDHGCNHKICEVDLKLENITMPAIFIEGSNQTLPISYQLLNLGENAFDAQVTVSVSPNLPFARTPNGCSLDTSTEIHELRCHLLEGQAFINGSKTIIDLILDVSKLEKIESLNLKATARSSGNEKNITDNTLNSTIILEQHADIILMGKPLALFTNLEETEEKLTVEFIYELQNNGPSTLYNFTTNFWTPMAIFNATQNKTYNIFNINTTTVNFRHSDAIIVQQLNYSMYNSSSSVSVVQPNGTVYHPKMTNLQPTNHSLILNCQDLGVICAKSNFTFEKIAPHQNVTVQILYELESKFAENVMKNTLAYVFIVPMLITEKVRNINITEKVKPIILVYRTKPHVPLWVYILAAVSGLLIFILLTHGLIKVGFFRRKIKEKLKAEIRKSMRYSQPVDKAADQDDIG